MKKKTSLLLMLVFIMLCMTGCSSVPKEKQIKQDIMDASSSLVLAENEKVVDIEIKDRKTDKKAKSDQVICIVKTELDNVSYEKGYTLSYHKFDNGWKMQSIIIGESADWVIKPLKGVNEEQIKNSLTYKTINVDGELWTIEDGEISDIVIKKQDTDLDKGKDKVTIKIKLNGEVEEVEGTIKAEYDFDKKWELKDMEDENDFSSKEKADKALNVNKEDLIAELSGREISVGETKSDVGNGISFIDYSTQQKIKINTDDISEFTINQQTKEEKGKGVTYECSCKLSKADVQYTLQVKYFYYYDGTWNDPSVRITPVLDTDSINLSGTWKGNYTGAGSSGTAELDINSEDGINYSGTYTYTSDKSYVNSGSYKVEGTFDKDTMQLKLKAGDWISKPDRPLSVEKQDILAIYYVDSSKLNGRGQCGDIFNINK